MGPFLGHVSTRPTRHRASVLERATIPPSLRHQGGHLTTKHPRVVLLTIAKDRLGCFVVPTQVGWWDRGILSISWTRASVWNRCTCRKEEKKASGACASRSHRQGRKDSFDRGGHDPHEDDGSVTNASFRPSLTRSRRGTACREGRALGLEEGESLGRWKGWEMGWEMGKCAGTVSLLVRILDKNAPTASEARILRKCRLFLDRLRRTPLHRADHEAYVQDLDRLRGLYKSIVSSREPDLSGLLDKPDPTATGF